MTIYKEGKEAMDIQKAYNDWSSTYDKDNNKTRDLDHQVIQSALSDLSVDTILEIGCGTGKNTPFLAQIGGLVHALDFSPGMLSVARQKISADNVHFIAADLSQPWPCDNGVYDLIICSLVLEHIEDLDWIFREANRTLRHPGRIYINELHPFRQYQGVQARFQRDDQAVEVPAFVHHISDFIRSARDNNFSLLDFTEHWHTEDQGQAPRLVSFVFKKSPTKTS